MNLKFDLEKIKEYKSSSQIARVLTENWVEENMFCPRCGNLSIKSFPNNRPVADFYCPICKNQFELKSKKNSLGRKINDGAYDTMIRRITSNDNPDFFFMSYVNNKVNDLIFVPKYFFVPEIIEKRKPLSSQARRAGWTGCNILIEKIPKQAKISIIYNGKDIAKYDIMKHISKLEGLNIKNISSRGWLIDTLKCVNHIDAQEFTLTQMYNFEQYLSQKYIKNKNIKAKIRQQLQFLRDKGYIEFLGNGKYRKIV